MPDKRLRGATEYSTHPPTLRARQRLAKLPPEKRREAQARNLEYNALWQTCNRVSRRNEYRQGSMDDRRNMLLSNLKAVIAKRREQGKTICGIDPSHMVERHIKKEMEILIAQTGAYAIPISLKGVSVDTRPGDMGPSTSPEAEGWADYEEEFELPYPNFSSIDARMDRIETLQRNIATLDRGIQSIRTVQNHLTRATHDLLAGVKSIRESSLRLENNLEILSHCMRMGGAPSAYMPEPMAHQGPPAPVMATMQLDDRLKTDGYLLPENTHSEYAQGMDPLGPNFPDYFS